MHPQRLASALQGTGRHPMLQQRLAHARRQALTTRQGIERPGRRVEAGFTGIDLPDAVLQRLMRLVLGHQAAHAQVKRTSPPEPART